MSSPSASSLGFRRAGRTLAIFSIVFACMIPSGCGGGAAYSTPLAPGSVQPPVTSNSQAATPTISPVAGTYTTAQSVTLSDTTSGAVIYYTTNGTTPTTSSTQYSGPISVSSTTTIEAMATASGMTNSGVALATYTIPATAFNLISNMTTARAGHIAVLLPNGKVLIAGGVSNGSSIPNPLASAELYDPSTRSFTPTGNMTIPRGYPAAVLLPNGKVLISGGNAQSLSAELYDPSTGTFTATGNMVPGGGNALNFVPSTLLQNGQVFVAGANAEVYDPASGTFASTVAYADANPLWGTATLLQDGRVLLTGCTAACGVAELYDPRAITFIAIAPMTVGGGNVNTATLLMNGKVLFVGNAENDGFPGDAELYDAAAETFSSIGQTTAPHEYSAAVRLSNGTVLITGGQLPGGNGSGGTDLYDQATNKFTSAGGMNVGRHQHTATLLPDGTVLITGGYSNWPNATSNAEIYKPAP